MLHALCSQRDRFKSKAQELQEALAAANVRITAAESDTAAAKADNVALIERLKFVSSYTCVPIVGPSEFQRQISCHVLP